MNALRITLCDIRRIIKDKQAVIWLIIMPIGIIAMFGSFAANPRNQNTWVPVVNLDKHELSTIFIDQLESEGYFVDIRAATDEVNVKYWSRAIILPATFSQDLLAGEPVDIAFTKGKQYSDHTLSAQARLAQSIVKFTGAMIHVDPITHGWNEETKENLQKELAKPQKVTVKTIEHSALRPPPIGYAFSLPGYLIMFVLMNSIMYGGITLAEERAQKQFTRLSAAPVTPVEIFIGKVFGRLVVPLVQSLIILVFGYFAFGITWGDHPLALVPVLLCFSIFAGSMGMLFGSIFKTEQQISSVGILLTMILAGLGGCWWPIEIVPDTFKTIAKLTPTYWGLQALHDVMSFGKSFSAIIPECVVLLTFGLGLMALSIPFLRPGKN